MSSFEHAESEVEILKRVWELSQGLRKEAVTGHRAAADSSGRTAFRICPTCSP